MQVNSNDLIAMLKVQRNAMADDAAALKAMCDGYERTVAEQAARIAELEKSQKPKK